MKGILSGYYILISSFQIESSSEKFFAKYVARDSYPKQHIQRLQRGISFLIEKQPSILSQTSKAFLEMEQRARYSEGLKWHIACSENHGKVGKPIRECKE